MSLSWFPACGHVLVRNSRVFLFKIEESIPNYRFTADRSNLSRFPVTAWQIRPRFTAAARRFSFVSSEMLGFFPSRKGCSAQV